MSKRHRKYFHLVKLVDEEGRQVGLVRLTAPARKWRPEDWSPSPWRGNTLHVGKGATFYKNDPEKKKWSIEFGSENDGPYWWDLPDGAFPVWGNIEI